MSSYRPSGEQSRGEDPPVCLHIDSGWIAEPVEWFDRYDRTTINREEMEQSINAATKQFDGDNDWVGIWTFTQSPVDWSRTILVGLRSRSSAIWLTHFATGHPRFLSLRGSSTGWNEIDAFDADGPLINHGCGEAAELLESEGAKVLDLLGWLTLANARRLTNEWPY